MRSTRLVTSLAALLVACSGGGGNHTTHFDLGTGAGDMATKGPVDLAMQEGQFDFSMPATCNPPKTDCGGGVCTNLNTDAKNCGQCGLVCPQGQTCTAAVCGGGGGNMTGCNGLIACLNNCADQMCEMTCINNTTAQGKMLAQALFSCLDMACPSMNGGVCDQMSQNYNQAACDNCYQTAQNQGGKCANQLNACLANMP